MGEINPRLSWSENWYIFRDCSLAALVGITCGFVIDLFFPVPSREESAFRLIIMIIFQILISSFILFYLAQLYIIVFRTDPDFHYGFSIFSVIFYLVQVQLLDRLNILYYKITGKNFK